MLRRRCAITSTCRAERIESRARCDAAAVLREQYLERIGWMKAAKREISITTM